MTLREQLLSELKQRNEVAQAQIKELESKINLEAFSITTITGGALAGAARSACQRRMEAARREKDRVIQQNAWVSDMLSKYK